jgi:hypothetical protein
MFWERRFGGEITEGYAGHTDRHHKRLQSRVFQLHAILRTSQKAVLYGF